MNTLIPLSPDDRAVVPECPGQVMTVSRGSPGHDGTVSRLHGMHGATRYADFQEGGTRLSRDVPGQRRTLVWDR